MSATKIIANLGIPADGPSSLTSLSPATEIVIDILNLCENAIINRFQIMDLGKQCEELLYFLKEASEQQEPHMVNLMIQTTVASLEAVKKMILRWTNSYLIERIICQETTSQNIWRSNQGIRRFINALTSYSELETQCWLKHLEESRKIDREEALEYLTNPEKTQNVILEIAAAHDEHIDQLMIFIQNALSYYARGSRQHSALACIVLAVQNFSGHLLPHSDLKVGEVRRIGQYPVNGSSLFDIWEGEYLAGERCIIKVMRGVEATPLIRERFLLESEIWREIYSVEKGEHVMPCWGTYYGIDSLVGLVYPWTQNGNVSTHLKIHPDINRRALILHVAKGLKIMHKHDPPIVHGDLRAANVFINDKANPVLANFNLYHAIEGLTNAPLNFAASFARLDHVRNCSPELLDQDECTTPASDIYAFAMTMLEIFTDQLPFAHIKAGRPARVLGEILCGQRPRRPEGQIYVDRGLDDKTWILIQRCWSEKPADRPTIDEVLEILST